MNAILTNLIFKSEFYMFLLDDKYMFLKHQTFAHCVFCSKNANNSESEVVQYELDVAAMADVILQG